MSQVQVTCLIEQHLEETAQNEPGGESGKFKLTSGQLPVYFRRISGPYNQPIFKHLETIQWISWMLKCSD